MRLRQYTRMFRRVPSKSVIQAESPDKVSGAAPPRAIREQDVLIREVASDRLTRFRWSQRCERGDSNSHGLSATGS